MADLILDTGAVVALLNRKDESHVSCTEFFKNFQGRLFSTEPVLTESLYLLSHSFDNEKKCLLFFQEEIQLVASSRKILSQTLTLMEKYQDIPMDFADATLVALAEEIETGDIFTLDRRGFETYRWERNKTFKIYPDSK